MQIFMISGKARNGKDTLAKFLKNYLEMRGRKVCIMHLSIYLKNMIMNYFGWDGSDEDKPRSFMQELGTDIIRKKLGKNDYFTKRIVEDIEILNEYYDTFIISDVRLPFEFEEIKKIYPSTIKINIERINFTNSLTEKEKAHITETALDDYNDFDYKIINDNLDNLEKDAKKIVLEVIDNA